VSYLLWKTLHIIAAVLFLGNIITGLFWAAQAHATRNFDHIAATFAAISKSDRWFTVPGVIGILVSGVAAAIQGHLPILGTPWILWAIILFSLSGIVYGFWLAPLQRQIAALAHKAGDTSQGWDDYARLYRRWEWFGLAALLTPAAALVIMVLKPNLPGL
jgi:uncharacterized membrane protein